MWCTERMKMSLFKKPKKNIRRREIGSVDEEDGTADKSSKMEADEEEENIVQLRNKIAKAKDKSERRKQTLLSFEEDFNEADDGEVFQVKKSSQSKKMMKQLDRERKKKKEAKVEVEKPVEDKNKPKEIVTGDLIMVVKQTEPLKKPSPHILNGREAEVADPDYNSADDDDDEKSNDRSQHTFSQPDHMKMLLESGRIPDAAMIHAARKRRQKAREMCGEFIPLDESHKTDSSKSRLVREDDNDASDDEECIQMTVDTAKRDLNRWRDAFNSVEPESDKGEEDDWEAQQIRKGVTGAQLAAVTQESLYQQQYSLPHVPSESVCTPHAPLDSAVVAVEKLLTSSLRPENGSVATTQSISTRLGQRLADLREVHRRHQLDRDSAADDLVTTEADAERLEEEAPKLAKRFRFYQELRGYVTDLVECLDEKMPILLSLEKRVITLLGRRAQDLAERRRQDVRDQADEQAMKTSTSRRCLEDEEARVRRAAEREGRRIRRMRAREIKRNAGGDFNIAAKHSDGLSSDDEMTEVETTSFRNLRELIEQDAAMVFDDVVDDFCSIKCVLERFESWRTADWDSYTEAYVSMCIPKVLSPLLKLELLFWNPLQDENYDLESTKWYGDLLLYGLKRDETEETLRKDPDLKLVPLIVEKVVLPKLNDIVSAAWDPLSTTQTFRLVGIVNRFVQEYPSLAGSSRQLNVLLESVVKKMREAVENDVFIPIYPRQLLEGKTGAASVTAYFQRQVVSAMKLLRNLLSWAGLVSDAVLQDVALGALLNRYLLVALRSCDPMDAKEKCRLISNNLPRWWFQSETILPHFQMFANQIKHIISTIDASTPAGRNSVETLNIILRNVQPNSSQAATS